MLTESIMTGDDSLGISMVIVDVARYADDSNIVDAIGTVVMSLLFREYEVAFGDFVTSCTSVVAEIGGDSMIVDKFVRWLSGVEAEEERDAVNM